MEVQNQGDRIGRIFTYWVIVYFEQFFEKDKRNTKFGQVCPLVKVVYYLTKMGWAPFWAIFPQTHLVTLF
jgi:hypothetical protein